MLTFPPSPALSECDSLADIDDLDAFLNAQGKLSHFPTPPQRDIRVTVEEIRNDEEDEYSNVNYRNMAHCMLQQTAPTHAQADRHPELVERILLRSRLPPEILAIAFNLLAKLRQLRAQPQDSDGTSILQLSPSLQVLSALALSMAYADDHSFSFRFWSRCISDLKWSASQINEATMRMLAALDWRLHDLATPQAVADTMVLFESAPAVEVSWDYHGRSERFEYSVPKLAVDTTLCIDGLEAVWSHGLVTPLTTPTSIATGDLDGLYLRLL